MQVSLLSFNLDIISSTDNDGTLSMQAIKSSLARKCLKNTNGDMLLQNLSKEAKCALNGFNLNLSNIKKLSSLLPEQDKHLLIPPSCLPASDLYDVMHLIQLGRSPGEAQQLYSRLIMKYYDMDRNLRVSSSKLFLLQKYLTFVNDFKCIFRIESTKILNQTLISRA